jgi:hypothetical protein
MTALPEKKADSTQQPKTDADWWLGWGFALEILKAAGYEVGPRKRTGLHFGTQALD